MKKTAIVILNWNGAHMMRQYLPTVIANSADEAEVIVADNASSDDSIAMLREQFPEVRIILLDQNYGFAEGYNRALHEVDNIYEHNGSKAEYYILLNSDVETPAHWLTPLISFMDANTEAAACQPKLHSIADKSMFEYAGGAGGYIDRYGYPFCKGRIFNTLEKDNGQYDGTSEIFWATGACMMVRAKAYWEAGGLDGRFFAHNEEIDLCWRLHLYGHKIYCVGDSTVYHLGGGTLPKGNPRKTMLNFRNNLTMLFKNLPEGELQHVMRIRFWLDWLAAIQMLVLGRSWGDFRAVLRGRSEFNNWKKDFDEERRKIQSSCVSHDIPTKTNKSILWQYYAKGIKRFSQGNW